MWLRQPDLNIIFLFRCTLDIAKVALFDRIQTPSSFLDIFLV